MNPWPIFAAIAAGWMLQLWLAHRQSDSYLRAARELRAHGVVATGQGGRRYRGGVAFVSLATDGRRVTAARELRGFSTFARARPVPELVGLRLAVLAGDRPVEGLRDNERAAARQAAQLLRAARAHEPAGCAPSDPGTPPVSRAPQPA